MSEFKHTANGPIYMFAPKELADRMQREAMEARLNRLIEIEEHIAAVKRDKEIVAQ